MKLLNYFFLVVFFSVHSFGDAHSFTMENDYLTGTDKHYTNGLFYTYMSDDASIPSILDIGNASQKNVAFSISQLMYTPEDLSVAEKQLDDGPYAGYLRLDYLIFQSTSNYFHEIGFNIGAVGPISYAEESQKFVHKISGNREPEGWDNQLENHLTAGVAYHFGIKTNKIDILDHKFDWLANIRFDRGNFYAGNLIGTTLRFGRDLPDNFYTGGNFIGGNESALLNFSKSSGFNWYIALGVNFNSIDKFFITDEDEEYTVQGVDYTVGEHLSFNLQYDNLEFSLYFKTTYLIHFDFDSDSFEKWGGIQFKWSGN